MSKRTIARAAITIAVAALIPMTSSGNHIVIAGPTWYPDAVGSNTVNFVHQEVESTMCCGGSPAYSFGDDTFGFMLVTINQHTPPGTYEGWLFRESTFEFLGSFDVVVSHAGIPPAPHGSVPTTQIEFSHTYPAAGAYTVAWTDCCLGSPQIPSSVGRPIPPEASGPINQVLGLLHGLLLSDVQWELDDVWYSELVPVFEEYVQALSPLGVSGGTATVIAI